MTHDLDTLLAKTNLFDHVKYVTTNTFHSPDRSVHIKEDDDEIVLTLNPKNPLNGGSGLMIWLDMNYQYKNSIAKRYAPMPRKPKGE